VIRTATVEDLSALRELFGRANDAPYELERVAEEKCFGEGFAGQPIVRVFGDFLGASVTCGKWLRILAVDRAARRQGIGSALLADANPTVIAAEPGNYFTPGVFADDEASLAFFRNRGYVESARTTNLIAPSNSATQQASNLVHRPTHSDRDRFLAFIEREFGKMWRFEASKAFHVETPTAFYSEEDGEITGFVVHEANNRGLGVFGPVGIIKRVRGTGIGRELVLASLADLHRLGYERAIIPWTAAIDYYRRTCGAEPAHQFVGLVSTS
jgi:GNAT superfamily N-acetyltransferase